MSRKQLINYHTDIGPSVDVVYAYLRSISNLTAGRFAYGLKQVAYGCFQLIFWLSGNRLYEVIANRFGVSPNDVGNDAHC